MGRRPVGSSFGWIVALLGLSVALWPTGAQAQESPNGAASTAQAPRPPQVSSAPAAHGVGPGWDHHPMFWLGSLGRADLRIRLQQDARDSDAPLVDGTWFMPLRRVGVGGQLRGGFDFEITAEAGVQRPWRDVYVNFRRFPAAMLEAGKFKVPFSLDQLTSESSYDFVYRSRISDQLAPGRERGLMLHGRIAARTLYYQTGVFAHDGINARTTDPTRVVAGPTFVARLTWQPFVARKTAESDLQIGVNATFSDVDEGYLGLRGRTATRATYYAPRLLVQGHQRRQGADLLWRPGPFAFRTEWARATVERRGVDDLLGDLPTIVGTGWYASAAWVVTGERKLAGVDPPQHAFPGGRGALEVAARTEGLTFHAPGAVSNQDHVQTMGVTWYVDRWVKLQFNVVHEHLADPLQGPLPTSASFWSRVGRVQFRF